jgi:hypothetical protein
MDFSLSELSAFSGQLSAAFLVSELLLEKI